MIQFDNVSFAYEKDHPILNHISFTIKDGESVGLIGANGAGKSTLLKGLLGLLPCEGTIYVDDLIVKKENYNAIRTKLGLVLQNSDNQMFMPTVYDDILFGPLNYGVNRNDAQNKADAILEKLNLSELKHRHNHKLSGGEKRMAAIATVLAMEPEVLLMDEPTSTLDPYNRRKIIQTIVSLPNTKLITSHDLDLIMDTCDRVILLSNGSIVADGDAKDILQNQTLLEAHRMELPLSYQIKHNK